MYLFPCRFKPYKASIVTKPGKRSNNEVTSHKTSTDGLTLIIQR